MFAILLVSTAFAAGLSATQTLTTDLEAQQATHVQIVKEQREPGLAQLEYTATLPKSGAIHSVATYRLNEGQWILTDVRPLEKSVEFTSETVVQR